MPTPIAIGAQITTITLQDTGNAAQTNVPITFGQVFEQGTLMAAGAALSLRAPDNSLIPCQIDVKVTNSDGSVRHAILSAVIPTLAAGATVIYGIVRVAQGPSGAAPVPANFAGLNATVLLDDTGTDVAGPQAPVSYTADAAAALASGSYVTWLSGPIVSEWIVRAPLKTAGGVEHPDLHARLHIRAYAGQAKAKIDYIIENTWAKKKMVASGTSPWEDVSINSRIYRFSLKAGSTTVHTRAVNGYTATRLNFNNNGTYDGNATGLANDATVYTATITVDGVAKPISITGSAAQNYGQLRALLNTQLGGAATVGVDAGGLGLRFTSASTGANSRVIISYGTLFPALSHNPVYRPIYGDEVIHYARTRWRKTFWWGQAPSVHLAHDRTHLTDVKAVPKYDPALTGDAATIASRKASIDANGDIGQNGNTKAYMGDVGYAPGIGVLPEWAAMYLVNGGVDAKYTLLKQADLGGGWPMYVRDYDTDRPISLNDWPYATFQPNAGDSYNSVTKLNEKLPNLVSVPAIPNTLNSPDVAHHPDFYFLPYLLTGDYWYMEGLAFHQRYMALDANPSVNYRNGKKALWSMEQVRGQAWEIRTTAHALYLLPDGHALRDEIEYSFAENLAYYRSKYIDQVSTVSNNFGMILNGTALPYSYAGNNNTGIAPWQDDFMTSAVGRAVELGRSEWLPMLQFKAKCPVGRLTSGAAFCWQFGASYTYRVRDTSASVWYTDWGTVFQQSAPAAALTAQCGTQAMATALGSEVNGMIGYPTDVGGYPANMQPAVAYAASYDTTGGRDSWTVFDARVGKPNYNLAPQFAIVPRAQEAQQVTAPPDIYQVATGLPIYGGRAAPNAPAPTLFDSLTYTDGSAIPGASYDGQPLVIMLHGSSGADLVNGRQYQATVSGYMAFLDQTNFRFNLALRQNFTTAYNPTLSPTDKWFNGTTNVESFHSGFQLADGKIHLTSERRYDAMLDWSDANLTRYNLRKRVLTGGSMGGWGTIWFGVRRYNRFAALYADRPRWRYGYSVGNVAFVNFTTGNSSAAIANSPLKAAEDGGTSYAEHQDMIAYISNPANKVRWIGWCLGRNDGYATWQDQVDAVAALRATKRGFAFYWNNGDHSTGSQMAQIVKSYPLGTFSMDSGYPLFTEHSLDKDPNVDLVGGINIGLSFRNVVESANSWSCEVTNVDGACTVNVEPISEVFKSVVAKKSVTIPAANTWVPVSFSV